MMARIRTIKPDFWQHPKTAEISRDARLLFIGLLNEADDEGRMRYSAKRLAGVLFPFDDDVTPGMLDIWVGALERAGLAQRYEVEEATYLGICGFSVHQRINRKTESALPEPPARTLTESSLSPRGALIEVVHREVEREREQGGGSAVDEQCVSPHELNEPAFPPKEVTERIRTHRWAGHVTTEEVAEAHFVLTQEKIPESILLDALTTSDPFPSKWKARARALHAEQQPRIPRLEELPMCASCCRSGFVLNDQGDAVPCPECRTDVRPVQEATA